MYLCVFIYICIYICVFICVLFSVPRCTTEDTKLYGYDIPKGTWIFVNRWGLHAAQKYWPNPARFDPTRFLNKEGVVIWPEAFVPFGMGKYLILYKRTRC